MPFTIAAPTMVPGLRWLCSLMHTSGSRSAFRAGLPWAPTTLIGLFCVGPWELCRRSTLGVCRFFSGRDSSGAPTTQLLDLRLDALKRPIWQHCTLVAWLSVLIESLAQLGNVLHCPVNATTHCKSCTQVSDQKNNSKTVSASISIHHHRDDQLTCTPRDAQSAPDNYSAMA